MDNQEYLYECAEPILEEPNILNALFKYSLLHQEASSKNDSRHSVYQPDPASVLKIMNEKGASLTSRQDIIARLPQKNLCDLEPHERFKRMILENNLKNGQQTASSLNDNLQLSTESSIRSTLHNQQFLMAKIDKLNSKFVQGNIIKSDQDADLRDLQRLLTSYNPDPTIFRAINTPFNGNNTSFNNVNSVNLNNISKNNNDNLNCSGNSSSCGSEPNDNNPNNVQHNTNGQLLNGDGQHFIQKRIRRPRADQIVKKVKEDTKNLLRNYGNAQSRFVLNNVYAQRKIDKHFESNEESMEDFKRWVAQLKLENFEQFKNVWHVQKDEPNEEYKKLFREICFDFYENHASVYVLGSQMRSEDTRKTHIKYICRFLEGIVDPNSFYYFKKN